MAARLQNQNRNQPRNRNIIEKEHRVAMCRVTMPSNNNVEVTKPAIRCGCIGGCSFRVRMTPLRAGGLMGGREFRIVQHEMNTTIKQHENPENRGGVYSRFEVVELMKIQNPCLWKRFRQKEEDIYRQIGFVNEKILFHGTSSAETIAQTGFDLNQADHDNMFGRAAYFAKNSSKSNQYVYGHMNGDGCPHHGSKSCYSCTRQMLMCRVALGCMFIKTEADMALDAPPAGRHSIVGKPDPNGDLKFYEYAVYDADQIYPEYLITYKLVP